MLDKRRVELLLDRVLLDRLDDETETEAVERWWRENADRICGAQTFTKPVVDVCRTL